MKVGYEGQDSPTWIASDGRWQNGPLHGQSQKDFAQYIGHDAREKQRIRRLEAVRTDLERLGEQSNRLDQQRQSIDDRIRAIAKQLDAFPSDSGIRQAATAVTIAAKAIIERRKGLTEAEHVVADHQTTMGSAREARDRDARDLGLLNWVGRLDELERTTTDYRRILESLWPSIEHFESLKAQYVAAVAAVQEAERDVQLREEQQHEKQIRHARASQRLKTLQETIGAEAAEIQRELAAAEELRRRLHEGLKQARSDESKAGSELARADERIKLRRETVNTDTERRQSSCDAFQRLCSLGLLKTAGESPDDDTGRWSVSRTVEIARQTESAFSQISDDDAAWDRVQQAVTTTIQDLNTALSQHAFTSTLSTTDGLYCVTVPYQGRDRSIHELRELLSEEVQQRQLVLDEREREVIENHLIGEVASNSPLKKSLDSHAIISGA